jgi:hypothetical protein
LQVIFGRNIEERKQRSNQAVVLAGAKSSYFQTAFGPLKLPNDRRKLDDLRPGPKQAKDSRTVAFHGGAKNHFGNTASKKRLNLRNDF